VLIVSAAALLDISGRVLVQKRPEDGRELAGLWEFPGGKVEPGEAVDAALARELREELGIAVTPVHLVPLSFSHMRANGGDLLLLLFACREWQGDLRPLPGHDLVWLYPSELDGLPMPPADLPLVAALRRLV